MLSFHIVKEVQRVQNYIFETSKSFQIQKNSISPKIGQQHCLKFTEIHEAPNGLKFLHKHPYVMRNPTDFWLNF